MQNSVFIIGLVVVALGISFLVIYGVSLFEKRRSKSLKSEARKSAGSVLFLFDDETSVDATRSAHQFMTSSPRMSATSDWGHLANLLKAKFPSLTEQIGELAELGEMTIISNDGETRIEAAWLDGLARVEIVDSGEPTNATAPDALSLAAMQDELTSLRSTVQSIPHLVWREDSDGKITWANHAYIETAEEQSGNVDVAAWPPMQLFPRSAITEVIEDQADQPRRIALDLGERAERSWFEVYETQKGEEFLRTAIPADKLVRAETSLSEFVATLSKTFAQLPIGLAIFDRKRQLVMFNPALTDLLALPVTFLAGQPSLFTFLDGLRENRMMPEPKDYVSWRQQMSDLEAAAVNGTYEETWSLPTGQTYRVSGQPQPGGAVAFLFEDISAEISLTRRFRSELEMGQSTIDALPDAIAVFTTGGILSMSNFAYDELWGTNTTEGIGSINVGDAIYSWRKKTAETEAWKQLTAFIATNENRSPQSAIVSLHDGQTLACKYTPLIRGATMVSFSQIPTQSHSREIDAPMSIEA